MAKLCFLALCRFVADVPPALPARDARLCQAQAQQQSSRTGHDRIQLVHPMIVHFPIVLLLTTLILDFATMARSGELGVNVAAAKP